ncbi:hypothetical protein D7V88_37765 [Corallococcus terminator]|uniref:Uncharacterized protein n=1 Tax=Corallococcus terminator TaxID=2316733 RepID=A0A3A8HPL6_9BACT|nr:hypothetical protein D7V88_37765 [Corallococcus terminator]
MTRLGHGRSVEILLVMDDRELLAALRTRLRQTSSEQSPVWGVLKGLRSHVARCLQEEDLSGVRATTSSPTPSSGSVSTA